ncbi:unnamed protein product [Danaus chrysippus]|uniref:(African queen) hypothetical protein n=1 Tax=Danaus chrysippus TaxID=151541 RepID=A0A8J2W7L8_9NEOP|nr:unnamed protein product [Danaus chrysippus]
MVIQEGLLCRECDTPLDSDKHFLGRTSRSKCPYATSCYRAMLRHSGYCAGSLSLEAAPRPAPTLYCICEYSTDISTDILSHLLVTQHTNAYLTEELARANTVREEPKPADEVEPMIPVYAEGCELTANVLFYMDHLKQHQDKELEIKCTRCVLRFVRLGE